MVVVGYRAPELRTQLPKHLSLVTYRDQTPLTCSLSDLQPHQVCKSKTVQTQGLQFITLKKAVCASTPYITLTLGVGMNAVPGGHFPLPSEVAYLMSRIPPPQCFNVRSLSYNPSHLTNKVMHYYLSTNPSH